MKENLEEMRRQGIKTPVVLGGAALTRSYVEEDCSEAYGRRVEYARDAFSGLRFMEKLKNGVIDDTAPIARKTRRPLPTDPRDVEEIREIPPLIAPTGNQVVDLRLDAIVPYLNTDVLFKHQWGFLRKNLATEEHQAQLREVATPKLHEMLKSASKDGTIRPRAVHGNFRVKKDGDSLVFEDGTRLDFPRQTRADGRGLCLVDYLRDIDTVGLMAVTVGEGHSEATRKLYEENRYTDYLYLHGLGAESTEATAEYVHRMIRTQWGISDGDSTHIPDFFHKKYQGCRYSWGYPAVPDMADQRKVLNLLQAHRIGVSMDDDEQLYPELSTCAIVLHHPQAHWFKT
jgi:5-methyltetrahydrofolate--homocysteine methyltransferase